MNFLDLSQNQTRNLLLLIPVLAIVSLFLLASSINNLEISPGERFFISEQQENVPDLDGRHQGLGRAFFRILTFLVITLFLLSLVVVIRSAENRKRALKLIGKNLLILAGFMLLIGLFSNITNPEDQADEGDTSPVITSPFIQPPGNLDEQEPAIPLKFSPPVEPPGLIYLVTLILLIAAGMAGYRFWQTHQAPKQQLHNIARTALDDLASTGGRDWQDIVIRCYADMSATVNKRMELQRNKSMTPAEFSSRLEKAGLPSKPVHNLTRLFEKARYGNRQSNTIEVNEAIACLSAIMQAVERRT